MTGKSPVRTFLVILVAGLSAALAPPSWAADGAVWITAAKCAAVASTHPTTVANAPTRDPLENTWICFRKSLDLPAVPKSAVVRIAVDSKYWLWVNGRLVVFEGGLKRGPDRSDTYCDSVDLSPYLQTGRNEIAILTWYFGKEGFSHLSSGMPGLFVDGNVGGVWLRSDATWKAMIHPAFGQTDKPVPNFRLPESNVHFDGRKDPGGWMAPDFNDANWPAASALGAPPCAPWGKLVDRPTPLWRFSSLRDYTSAADLPTAADGKPIIAKLPYDAQITPYLKVDAPAGLTIDMRTDTYITTGQPSVRSEYVTRPGIQEFESPAWMSGNEVIYSIPAGVKVLALKYRESGYDCDFAGSFHCDDDFYNQLWLRARRTLYVNMRDTYMDCPDRERAQWWGDIVIDLGQQAYALDRRSDAIIAKGLRELAAWQRADGSLFAPIPAGNWDKELPQQILATVGWYGAWTYYLNTGDAGTIKSIYPVIKRYLDLWKIGDDGPVIHRKGGWDWCDWGKNIDVPLLDNAWYALALRGAENMAKVAGDNAGESAFADRRATIQKNFDHHFWTGSEYCSPDYKADTDDRGNALAVLAGLVPEEHYPAIRKVLSSHFNASPYLEKYVLESLFVMNDPDAALARMKKRYQNMVDDKYTTLDETWSGGTHNHAWSGGPLTLLSQKVAGLAPDSPGWERYTLSPQLGPLKNVEATVATPRGEIHVTIARDARHFKLTVDSPHGTLGHVRLPVDPADIQTVKFDGTEMPGKHTTFLLGPGKSEFEVEMKELNH